MSLVKALLFRRDRLWLTGVIGIALLILGSIYLLTRTGRPAHAFTAAQVTNTGAPAASFLPSTTERLVMRVTIPDAWNGFGGMTADTLAQNGTAEFYQASALSAIPALGTTTGVGFVDAGAAGFQGGGTETVVRDLDADSVMTTGADTQINDGGDDNTDATPAAGGALMDVVAGDNLCTDNVDGTLAARVWTSTAAGVDTIFCTADDTAGLSYIGAAGPVAATLVVTGNNWAATDDVLDATTDFWAENFSGELTYSAGADTNVYSIGAPAAGTAVINFAADCDGGGALTAACKSTGTVPVDSTEDIYYDNGAGPANTTDANVGTATAAQNNFVDRRDDLMTAITVSNSGTAINGSDIAAVRLWFETNAVAGLQTTGEADTLGGAFTMVTATSWSLSGLTTTTIPNTGREFYVVINVSSGPSSGASVAMRIPALVDGNANGAFDAGDTGVFTSSVNDGPTALVLNPNAQTLITGGGGGGGGGGSLPAGIASLTVTAPNGGETVQAGTSLPVNWSSSSASSVSSIRISYSSDGGLTFPNMIVASEPNDGTYPWPVPSTLSGTGFRVKVEGLSSDNVVLVSDMSDGNFTITATAPTPETPVTPPGGEDVPGVTSGSTYDPVAAGNASPTINADLNVVAVGAGTAVNCTSGSRIKGASFSAVYYCGADGKRYVFPSERIYMSWFSDFTGVVTVSDSTLASILLGGVVLYQPGDRMVKIESDPKVYAVAPGGLLRWVTTEALAASLYGANWNTKIDDVPVSFWSRYRFGPDITAP